MIISQPVTLGLTSPQGTPNPPHHSVDKGLMTTQTKCRPNDLIHRQGS